MRAKLAVAAAAVAAFVGRRTIADSLFAAKDQPSPRARSYVLERSATVNAPLSDVFRFFEDPDNLARITPGWMRFRIRRVDGLPMGKGTTIEYEIRPFAVPQRWRTEIVEYEPGRRFADLQTRGPYRYWRHEHSFEARGGETLMRDRVEYQLPFGALGRLAHTVAVARQLRAIFDYRTQAIDRFFPPSR